MTPPAAQAPFDLAEAIRALARTPAALHELLDEVSPAAAVAAPTGQWSAFDVVGHLIHAERTPEWIDWWVKRYRWSDDFGPQSYYVDE